jgi:hypothetical protein
MGQKKAFVAVMVVDAMLQPAIGNGESFLRSARSHGPERRYTIPNCGWIPYRKLSKTCIMTGSKDLTFLCNYWSIGPDALRSYFCIEIPRDTSHGRCPLGQFDSNRHVLFFLFPKVEYFLA